MSAPRLLRSVLSFSSLTLLSRVLGLVRDLSINYVFGASAATDAFWVAFRIPNFLRRLFAEGSFSTAFVPVFTQIKQTRPHADLRLLVSHVAGTLGAVLLVIVALGLWFAPELALVFNPRAEQSPEKFSYLVELLRLTFPFLLFVSLTALASGALNSFNRFALQAFTPVILNLSMIAGALWLAPRLEVPILALGWAVFAAGILQLLVQLPALVRLKLLSWPRWGGRSPDVRRIVRLMVPTLFGSSVAQINLLFDTLIAAFLIEGSQSWLAQADRFLELPLGVFGVALATVILPNLSRHHVAGDPQGFSRALDWGLRVTLLVCLPASVGLMLLAKPLVVTLFQYGKFTDLHAHMTALSVMGLSAGLPAFALVKVLLPAFYSRQDTRSPVRAGVAALLANMVLNALLLALLLALWVPEQVQQQGVLQALARVPGLHLALGIASALSSYINLFLLWRWLRRSGAYVPHAGWRVYLFRIGVACVAMAVMLGVLMPSLAALVETQWPERLLRMGGLVAVGLAVYVATLFVTGMRFSHISSSRG